MELFGLAFNVAELLFYAVVIIYIVKGWKK